MTDHLVSPDDMTDTILLTVTIWSN